MTILGAMLASLRGEVVSSANAVEVSAMRS